MKFTRISRFVYRLFICVIYCSESFGIDRAAEMKFTAIAASLLAAASADNGNVDEKERKLNEMIMELQLLKEGLTIRRVSVILFI